jgi:hypothetical protein
MISRGVEALGTQSTFENALRVLRAGGTLSSLGVYLNVIVAQTTLLNDQQIAVNFRMEKMVASVQLIKALGGGWDVKNIPPPDELKRRSSKPVSSSSDRLAKFLAPGSE